jgi:TolB protein
VKTNHVGTLAAAAGALVAARLLVLMLLVVVEARPAEATFPGKNGKIAYSSWDGQDDDIYTINAGGGGRFNVTDNATDEYYSSYSPDGKKIAYTGKEGPNGDWEIYTINPGGGSKVKVTDNSTDDDGGLSYSPSGKKIAYSGKDAPNGDYEIYTIDPGGGGKVQLTDNAAHDYTPSWGSSK